MVSLLGSGTSAAVATGAVAGGASAAVGGIRTVGGIPALAGHETAAVVARSMVANALTQGLSVALGLQDRMQGRSVAAAGLGSWAGQKVGSWAADTAADRAAASSMTAGLVTTIARGGQWNAIQVAVDMFGNQLGQSLGEAMLLGNVVGDQIVDGLQSQGAYAQGLRVSESTASNWGPHYDFDDPVQPVNYSRGTEGVCLAATADIEPEYSMGLNVQSQGDDGQWQTLYQRPSQPIPPGYGEGPLASFTRETGVSTYGVRAPGPIEVTAMTPGLALAQAPDMWEQYRADTASFYEQTRDQAVVNGNPAAYIAAKFGGLAGEMYHDMLARKPCIGCNVSTSRVPGLGD